MKTLAFFVAALLPAVALGDSLRDAYTHVAVTIDGDLARTVVTQVLVNDLDTAVEASFGFPLPADAAVTGFADWRDGRRVDARAADKEAARDAYDKAAGEGKHAALAESDGENRFTMKLAAIPARGSRRVELSYTQTLSVLGGERTFAFPALKSQSTVFDAEVTVAAEHVIVRAASLNHPDAIVERPAPERAVLRISRTHGGLGRDLVLRWQEEAGPTDLAARAVRAAAGEPAYVEARFALNSDPFPGARRPVDVVLVVDTSLSMAGEPLQRAQNLAAAVLGQLGPGDHASLVSFSDVVEVGAADARVVAALRAHGRSNLEAGIDAAADLLRKSENGLLILMTDGQPTAGDESLALAGRGADFAKSRVLIAHFNYPSRKAALEALFPGAATRYVPDGPAGEEAVAELVRLAVAPVLDDVRFELVGGGVTAQVGAIPARLGVGDFIRIMARADGDVVVRVSGHIDERPFQVEQTVTVADAPDGRGDRGLPVEWARMRVRDLEAGLAGKPMGPRAERGVGREDQIRVAAEEEIKVLGKKYGLVTRFTSYVATSDTVTPDSVMPGDPEIRVHAPRAALGVRALLPWGETVECSWLDDEQVWVGRFLVPRGTPDGRYQVRLFVDSQSGTVLRGSLSLRVDSRPPQLELRAEQVGVALHLVARLQKIDSKRDAIVPDAGDVKQVVVQVGDRAVVLRRKGKVWEATVPLTLGHGRHALRLTATDDALNSSETIAFFTR